MNEGALESLLLLEKSFKTSLIERFKSLARTDYFVDIGANFGQTLAEIFAYNQNIKYFGFEPNPEAFRLLKKIAELNSIEAQLYPWACTSEAKPIELYASSELDSGATILPEIRPDFYEHTRGTWIAGYPLDSVLPDSIPQSFVLKIDVEGSENEVLKGATKILAEKRPFILCEVLHAHRKNEIEHNNLRKKEVENILTAHNYCIYACTMNSSNREKLERIERVSELPKNIIYKDSPHTCDFVFIPNEISPIF
jgi:FkbM family methyltransferase